MPHSSYSQAQQSSEEPRDLEGLSDLDIQMGIMYDMQGMANTKRIYVDYQQPPLQCLTSQDLSIFIYM